MITHERPPDVPPAPPARPAPPQAGGGGDRPPIWTAYFPWWRMWPSPGGRPQPLNRRTFLLGALVMVPGLGLIDGLLAALAGYATHSWVVGLAVGGVLFLVMLLELGIVAWAVKRRQELEARRAQRG